MAAESRQEESSVMQLLTATFVGVLGVLMSLWAFSTLVGPQSTHATIEARLGSFIYWTQPFVYLGAGILAGQGNAKAGPMRAPIIGLFLAAFAYAIVRRLDLLPPGGTVMGYMITAGALFGLVGAVLATLLGDKAGKAVSLLAVVGVAAYIVAYFNLGSVSGEVKREMIQRAQGVTVAMDTVTVPDVPLWLRDPQSGVELYRTTSNASGRYLFGKVALGEYELYTISGQGQDRAMIKQCVTVERALLGGTPGQLVTLPAVIREAGNIFE